MKFSLKSNFLLAGLLFFALQLSFRGFAQTICINGTTTLTTPLLPSGGTMSTSSGYNIHIFNSSGTLTVPSAFNATAEILVVAGGGGGGLRHAGGGGAGGLINTPSYALTSTQNIVVGNGGAGDFDQTGSSNGANGGNSSFAGSVAIGGGGGGTNSKNGQAGGSGGGGSNGSFGGAGTAGQGMKGGNQNNGNGCCFANGCGGGGFSAAGANTGSLGSNGGAGASFSTSGTSVNYAGGGGGGTADGSAFYTGGIGGGGNGGNGSNLTGVDAITNTGGGGGGGGATGSTSGNGGAGASGVVIIKYASPGIWSSDNTAVATVDVNGVVTGHSAGTAHIKYTITSTSSSNYTITVSPTPNAVATPSSQTICSGSSITTIALTGNVSGTVYNWTRDNTAVTGIAASGTGDISGSLTNSTNAPVTVTFTVTPSYTNGGTTCTGAPTTATVTINPTPTAVAMPATQTICSGSSITTIALTGNVSGTVYNWIRDNAGVTGIAASGSGDISGSLTNPTSAAVTVTFTITPSYTNGGTTCNGTPIIATVVVNPTPDVAQPANQVVCNNTATAAVNFTGSVVGTSFNWTNNTTSIGLAASGSGYIPSFSAVNITNAPVISSIVVTPSTSDVGNITFNYSGSIINWTVPVGINSIVVTANGAAGGGANATTGLGVSITGSVNVTPGEIIKILVGENGKTTSRFGGGGGTFVTRNNNTPIIIAGGGGGVGVYMNAGGNGLTTTSGGNGGTSIGGINGNGGSIGNNGTAGGCGSFGSGGGGLLTNGDFSNNGGGNSFLNNGNGGSQPSHVCIPTGLGGFGGGGAGGNGGGGGGGYSGGAGGDNAYPYPGGGGGGSFNSGTNQTVNAGNLGNGLVQISYLLAGTTCTGTSKTFIYTVNPTPNTVATPSSQTICSGSSITTIALTGNVSGTVYNWTRDNAGVTGITATGTGDISGSLTNPTSAAVTVTFTITPSYTNGGTTCTGTPITATVVVNPTPNAVATPSSQTICSGSSITTIALTGNVSGMVYNWTRDNTVVTGITATGTGDISGSLTNSTNAPVTVTFTITPTANGCMGTAITATVVVNPTPNTVATPTSQRICTGSAIITIVLSGNVNGTVYNWIRDNTAVTGITATGTGNISGTLNNTTNAPVTVTFTITPIANGCTGTAITAKVTVNPTPDVAQPSNQVVCNNTATAAVNFSGSVTGTNYTWTNNNIATGLPASGTGNINSFTATNTSNAPIVGTITVTPTASGTPFAYIPNSSLANVSVINTVTNMVVATIPVGTTPVGVSASTDGSRVYVTSYSSNTVIVINTVTNTVVATVAVGSKPYGVSVSPDGSRAYVTNQISGNVSVINTANNTVVATVAVGTRPYGLSVSLDGSRVYVVNSTSGNVSVINTATNTVAATVQVGLAPYGATVSPDGSRLYVANFNSNNVSVINTATNTVVDSVAVGSGPSGLFVSPDGSRLYVANYNSGNVSAINTATDMVVATVVVGSRPIGVSVSPDGSQVYVANYGSNNVSVINTATNTVVSTVAVGSKPYALGNFISRGSPTCTGTAKTFTITVNPTPAATISYTGSPYCQNAGTASVNLTGTTGGSYSSTTGLIIDPTSGDVTLATSTAGTYTVTYTLAAGGGCAAVTTTTLITITTLPAATISYTGSPYCQNAGTASVTLTGTTGGSYSSTVGLIIDPTSGDVTLATSTAGTYTVTYTLAAGGGCAAVTTTTSITITTLPAATISYTGSPYCQNAGTASVTLTGTTGGSYSSTVGLIINSATGMVTLGNSTAGTYTVTYTLAAGGGCPSVTTTTSITITTLPAATISYTGSPYCQNAGTATVSRTGTTGGSYSSTAGLIIDPTSGDVTLGTSTPGTYTVTYTLAAGGGCPAVTTTTSITVNSLSVTPSGITPSALSFCGPHTVTLSVTRGSLGTGATWKWYSGTCGGTAIGTGASITIMASATNTYFVRAEGTCNSTACASVTITINPQPTISIAASNTTLLPGQRATLIATVTPADATNATVWYKNGIVVAGATGLTLVVDVDGLGVYSAKTTTVLGCTAMSNIITITTVQSSRLYIYPNPNDGHFSVRFYSDPSRLSNRHLVLYNANGQKMYDKVFFMTAPYSSVNVNVPNLAPGVYVVMITDFAINKVIATGKVIIK